MKREQAMTQPRSPVWPTIVAVGVLATVSCSPSRTEPVASVTQKSTTEAHVFPCDQILLAPITSEVDQKRVSICDSYKRVFDSIQRLSDAGRLDPEEAFGMFMVSAGAMWIALQEADPVSLDPDGSNAP